MKLHYHLVSASRWTILLLLIITAGAVAQEREREHGSSYSCGPEHPGPGLAPGEQGLIDRFNYPWHPGKHLALAQERRRALQRGPDCGGFSIDFEDVILGNGIGFDDPGPITHPVLGATTVGALRRRTVCEVLSYIGSIIDVKGSPDVIIRASQTDGSGFLAAASPFFSGAVGGFASGTFYDHITTGTDPTPAPGSYDAMVTFDFGFSYNDDWNAPPGNSIDLFSVMLHEITHALGVFSLIRPDGSSALGGGYSLFDRRMLDGSGARMVDPVTGAFNGNVAAITSDAVILEGETCGVVNPVYSPGAYRQGSSMSHFDSYRSGIRYVMRPATGGGDDRAYTVEEIQVLCDLGYTLHGRSCSRCAPRGIDDYGTTQQGVEVCIDVLANDVSPDGSPLTIDPASVRIEEGGGSFRIDGNLLCYTPDPGFTGLARLVYAPNNGDATGSRGRVLVNVFPTVPPGGITRRDAEIWYFGRNAGMSFASGIPVPLTDGRLQSLEAATTVCDRKTGALLFYTNGVTVWDATHHVMQGGEALASDESSTQGALVVPVPGDDSSYYLFTVTVEMRYSIIDMRANGGLGAVVTKDVLLFKPAAEKLTAAPHGNGRDYWVLTREWGTDLVHAFLVGCDGISGPVSSHTGGELLFKRADTGYTFRSTVGYMKVSPDGRRLVSANTFVWIPGADFTGASIELFDFDDMTGRISNRMILATDYEQCYGAAFSPNSSKLYVGSWMNGRPILQYDLSKPDEASIIASRRSIPLTGSVSLGALQLGPDGRIYVAVWQTPTLGIIARPDEVFPLCQFTQEGMHLGGQRSDRSLCNLIEGDLNRTIADTALLSLSKRVSDEHPHYGDTITYTISVCNLTDCGPVDATIEDVLPDGLDYVDGMDAYPRHTLYGIPAGECGSIALRAVVGNRVPLGTPVVNCATIVGRDPARDHVDLDSNCVTIMVRGTDLGITKTVDSVDGTAAGRVNYTITVTNYGPADATNAVVRDILPSGLEYVTHTVTGAGTYDPATGDLAIPLLPVGDMMTLRIECDIERGWHGNIINCAELVSLDQSDLDVTNNSACAFVMKECREGEIKVRGGIARNHSAGSGESIMVPVMLYDDVDVEQARRIAISVTYDSTVMALQNGRFVGELTDGTLLDGWRLVSVSDRRGHYSIELESPSPGDVISGTGVLLNLWFGMYLGRSVGSELPVTISLPESRCVDVVTEAGYARLDSICGLDLRLIELIPGTYGIKPVRPNPVEGVATFEFSIGLDAETRLEIIDAQGRHAATLVDEYLLPGRYMVEWEANRHPSGLYYYRISSGDWSETGRIVVVK